ncbi:MAG: class I SAM-dependent methyltransferase [Deltaproteobacteria bacterium]|nr:class I SAM-dependent methyltransferase [Deltaproteobacteria bacterium]
MAKKPTVTGKNLPEFDKYYHYRESVQSPDADAAFLEEIYRRARGRNPTVFREDFCGTFANCCAWVKRSSKNRAYGLDLDPEPINYGKNHYLTELTAEQQKRVHIELQNVLGRNLPRADVICALNFSYFIFKERQVLKKYFTACRKSLNPKGVFVIDAFGGPKCQEANEEVSENGNPPFDYYWDQDSFDPLTHEAVFHIHFKRKGEKKRLNVFTYDWRMWTLPELRDLLLEAGFSRVEYLWEGTNEHGEGDGDFKAVNKGEECEAWVAYLAAYA